ERARQLEAQAAAEQARRQAALDHALAVLSAAVDAVEARTVPIVREARATLHSTALDLAAAVLQHELRPGPDSARVLLERALDLPVELGVHTVRVNPVDLTHCEAVLRSGEVQLPEGTRLVADPRLAQGDTVSEYPDGFLDAQVQTALDRARAVLREDQA
uniref:FliH/SctL family protein n=1 Tax=Actinotalea sp. C106 TaxID=2908644 RepID=UPI0020295B47